MTYIGNNGLMKTKLNYVVLPLAIDIYFADAYYFANRKPNPGTEARLNVFSTIDGCLGFSLGIERNSAEVVGTNMTSYDGCFYINRSRTVNNVCVLYSIPRTKTSFTTYSGCDVTGMDLFKNSNLTSIVFNNGLLSMYGWAFQSLSSLTNVTLPASLKYISNSTFQNCSNLANFSTVNTAGVTSASSTILNFVNDQTTRIGNLLYIGDNAFNNCAYTGIVLPISTTLEFGKSVLYNGTVNKRAYIYVSDKYSDFYNLHYKSGATNPWVANVWNQGTKETIYYAETAADKTESTVRYWHYVNGAPEIW